MKIARRAARSLLVRCGALLWVCMIAADVVQLRQLEHWARAQQLETLTEMARVIAPQAARWFEPSATHDARAEASRAFAAIADARVTLIAPHGEVLADSQEPAWALDNHAGRPEVRAALEGRIEPQRRRSFTLGATMTYVAVPCRAGDRIVGVVRLARSEEAIARHWAPLQRRLWLELALIGGVGTAALAWVLTRAVRPLEELAQRAEGRATGGRTPVRLSDPGPWAPLAEVLDRSLQSFDERLRRVSLTLAEREVILASMREGVLVLDRDDRIRLLNRAAEELLGVAAADAVGRLMHEALRHAPLQRLVQRARAGADVLDEDRLIEWTDGRVLNVQCVPMRDDQGREAGLLVVMNDVTRLHQLEGLRREFVANVSHELRTPITSIKGFIETLREGAIHDPEHATQFLEILARQADRLNAIIEDMLTLSRLERPGGPRRLERTEVNVAALLTTVAQHYQPRAEARGIGLIVECPATLHVRANARLLEQAVGNLVDNAIKYSESEQSVRLVGCAEGGWVLIQVIDRGCGIAPEHLPRLFERFYRVDPARSRQAGGTGLGLAIVKHIVQIHGGEATVESRPGQGSTFTLRLPADS